jgi:denticleless
LLFALGADARVHTYCASSLEPLPTAIGSLGHPALSATSFYVRAAMSPCGRWLATGCAGAAGSAFLFDVAGLGRAAARASVPARAALTDGVRVRAQAGEVGAVDFARDGLLATCADEGTVRAWRPDAAVAARCRADPNEERLDWAWAENSTGQV